VQRNFKHELQASWAEVCQLGWGLACFNSQEQRGAQQEPSTSNPALVLTFCLHTLGWDSGVAFFGELLTPLCWNVRLSPLGVKSRRQSSRFSIENMYVQLATDPISKTIKDLNLRACAGKPQTDWQSENSKAISTC
jgi:hypothetical protein